MTELLYLTESYLREFTATVVDITEDGVVLDRTAFYPEGGGQPSDIGALLDERGRRCVVWSTRSTESHQQQAQRCRGLSTGTAGTS